MKRVCSIFSQILQLIPRDSFEAAVRQHRAERHARGFSSWGQFVAMLFCQLAQAKSLREITEGLQASEGKLRHLGLPEAPARSTLASANSHRPWQLFESVFQQVLTHCQKRLGVARLKCEREGGRELHMSNQRDHSTFEAAYAGKAPWDIGKPQGAIV